MPYITNKQVALVQELCAGVAESLAVNDEDNLLNQALHQVKEEVEQMVLSQTRPGGSFPRHAHKRALKSLGDVPNQGQHKFDARFERLEAEQRANARKEELERIFEGIRDSMNTAEAAMENEKDPQFGYAALDYIEAILKGDVEDETSEDEDMERGVW